MGDGSKYSFRKTTGTDLQKSTGVKPVSVTTIGKSTKSKKRKRSKPCVKLLSENELWGYYISLKRDEKKNEKEISLVRWFIVHKYKGVALSIARKYFRRNMPENSLAEREDLEQSAVLGLIQAIDSYDPSYGTSFMEYCNASGNRSRLRGAVIDCLRNLQDYPRIIAKHRREMKPIIEKINNRLGRKATIDELCDILGSEYKSIFEDPLFWSGVYNQMDTSQDEDGETSFDIPCHRSTSTPVSVSYDNELKILSCIEDETVRRTILMYYWLGLVNEKIAAILECSQSNVSNLLRRGLKEIEANFTPEEFQEMIH